MKIAPLLVVAFILSSSVAARASDGFTIRVQIGPVPGSAAAAKTVSFAQAAREQVRRFDIQDGREHNLRGVSLRALLALAGAPKRADAVLITYTDGMQIPVRLSDKKEVDAVFIALEHGDALDRFTSRYPLLGLQTELACPKVVYSRKVTGHSVWRYPTELASIRIVAWNAYVAELAQPTRNLPDRSGWPTYLKHCQPCHGIGGQGATRGPDFASQMEAYRRIPPHENTDWEDPPSLHDKIKGYADGTMPALRHVSNAEITTLWRWLHLVHRGTTK